MTHLNIGDNAPHFNGNIEDGSKVSSSSLKGQKYILFFYPKDDTPGCTREACNLRDNFRWFEKNGFQIFGVSPDNEKKHQKFIDKFQLPFPLLLDEEHEIAKAFGVWGEKKFMGRTFEGIHRMTFLINESGKIERSFIKVKAKSHPEELVREL